LEKVVKTHTQRERERERERKRETETDRQTDRDRVPAIYTPPSPQIYSLVNSGNLWNIVHTIRLDNKDRR